jgi:hypothetical protein
VRTRTSICPYECMFSLQAIGSLTDTCSVAELCGPQTVLLAVPPVQNNCLISDTAPYQIPSALVSRHVLCTVREQTIKKPG